MTKNLVLVIKANQDYIRHSKKEFVDVEPELNSLFESVSDIYIPFLNLFENLEKDGVKAKVGFVFPPVLCAMLENTEIQDMYVTWLKNRNLLGKSELKRCSDDSKVTELIKNQIEKNEKLEKDFVEKYNRNLVKAFADYHKKGYVELIATTGTDIYIPHYSDIPEVVSAQIETGLQSYRKCFDEFPDGFWLPDLGYIDGVEKIIRSYGYLYTILDSRSVLLSDKIPSTGIFYPSRTENSLAVFANDPYLDDEIYSEDGFINNFVYRNENRDVGYELPMKQLDPVMHEGEGRFSTGFRYWNRCFNNNTNSIYDIQKAHEQAKEDAHKFLENKADLLSKAEELLPKTNFVQLTCTFDASKLHQNWAECIVWFEEILRSADKYSINITSNNAMLDKQFSYEKVKPYYSSHEGTGYGENLLSSKNCWMMRYIRKACERMVDLADRFPNDTGLKTRLLNLGAKELMIAQSSGLLKMIEDDEFPEYAENRFKESINAFTAVFDSLGSNTVSTEWLTTLEIYDDIFPWMNYRIFSKKK